MSEAQIRINDPEAGKRILALAGGALHNPQAETVISRHVNGELYGGAVYSGYTGWGGAVEVHNAGFRPNWISRDLVWMCFDYPFKQLGCKKLICRVKASNHEALRLNLHFGFAVEATIKDVYPDSDLLILGLYAEGCRWLDIKPRVIKSNRSELDGQA